MGFIDFVFNVGKAFVDHAKEEVDRVEKVARKLDLDQYDSDTLYEKSKSASLSEKKAIYVILKRRGYKRLKQ